MTVVAIKSTLKLSHNNIVMLLGTPEVQCVSMKEASESELWHENTQKL